MNRKNENIIIVSGTPRGGTTILAESLIKTLEIPLIWEPLQPWILNGYMNGFDKELGGIPYIPKDAEWEEAKAYFNAVFQGKYLSNSMIDRLSHVRNWHVNGRLIKMVRANMLLPWAAKNFNCKIIYIVRHPCAVISSQIKHSKFDEVTINFKYENLLKARYGEYFKPFQDKLTVGLSQIELLAHKWALSNSIPLSENNATDWITVSYESLVTNPVFEAKRIAEYLESDIKEPLLNNLNTPSSSLNRPEASFDMNKQLGIWKERLTQGQIDLIHEIIRDYGLTMYSEDPEPDYRELGYELCPS